MNETYFLEMIQTIPADDVSTLVVHLRIRVESPEAAPALRDELAARFFVGLQFTAKLHVHRTDGPCEVWEL